MFELKKQHQALDRKEVLKLSLEVINLKRLNSNKSIPKRIP
jgi:hypothetical protein